MKDGQQRKRTVAEALLGASCAAHNLDPSVANRDAVIKNVCALIDAFEIVRAFPLPDELEPANIFRALP